jgi:bifunctional N-acetylglucosamine-1-phosphate-uridyltransferase/glucosamine-1-phosphate-acetyltransferase GlmU-like protein
MEEYYEEDLYDEGVSNAESFMNQMSSSWSIGTFARLRPQISKKNKPKIETFCESKLNIFIIIIIYL